MLTYLNRKMRNKGQSTLEYAILIVIVLGALLTIQVYIKRGLQGRLKSATDDIGTQFSVGNQNAITRTVTTSLTSETFVDGQSSTVMINPEITTEETNSEVITPTQEYWGND